MDGPVDWNRFREMALGEADPRDLATFYLSYVEGQFEEMRTALAGGRAVELERLAHGTAGSSATTGANAIVPALVQLELLAHEGSLTGAGDLLADAAEAFARVRQCFVDEGLVDTND